MKVKDFLKQVLIPVLSAVFLVVLLRPLCVEGGECNYLKLWLLSGIPFGVTRMCLWVIPKGYDIGGSMGILFINLLVGGAIGGIVLIWKLTVAAVYFVKAVDAGVIWSVRKVSGKP